MNNSNSISKSQSIDTGMAATLILLIIGNVILTHPLCNILAIITLVITMSVPTIFKPVAVLWFGFSEILGNVMSRIVLSIIFYGFLTPYGRSILLFKKDPMNRKSFKKSTGSVFISRDKTFVKKDLEYAY